MLYRGWSVVAGTFVAQLTVVGFFTYSGSLLVAPVREEFGASLEQVMYAMTGATLMGFIMMPLGGIAIDRFPARRVMVGGTLLTALGLYFLSLSPDITSYIILFSLTMSCANALAGTTCCSTVISRWFSSKRGRALGISAVGTSIGGMIIPAVFANWLDADGWRASLQQVSLIYLVVTLPVLLLTISSSPQEAGVHGEDHSREERTPPGSALSFGEILRSSGYWYMALSLGLLFSAYSAMVANITPYALSRGLTTEHASAFIMILAVSGLIGKLALGVVADRTSPKLGLWIAQGLVMISFMVLSQEPGYNMITAAMITLGLAAGGMLPVWGAMVPRVFGLTSYGRAMGLMGPMITLCVLPGFPIVGRLVDLSGSYVLSMQIFAGVCLLSATVLIPLRLEPAKVKEKVRARI